MGRPVHHPTPHFEPRPVIHPTPHFAPRPVESPDSLQPIISHTRACRVSKPFLMPLEPAPSSPVPAEPIRKTLAKMVDARSGVGRMVDMFA